MNRKYLWLIGAMLLIGGGCESKKSEPAQPASAASQQPSAGALAKGPALSNVIKLDSKAQAAISVLATDSYSIDVSGVSDIKQGSLLVMHVPSSPRSHYYFLPIVAGTNKYEFSAKTTQHTDGSPAFRGLEKQGTAFLLIGKEPYEGALDDGMFQDQLSLSLKAE